MPVAGLECYFCYVPARVYFPIVKSLPNRKRTSSVVSMGGIDRTTTCSTTIWTCVLIQTGNLSVVKYNLFQDAEVEWMDISVTVPAGQSTISNGKCAGKQKLSEGYVS